MGKNNVAEQGTRLAELEAQKAELERTLKTLAVLYQNKSNDVARLKAAASSSLAGVDVAELDKAAHTQALARAEQDAAGLAAAELGRRVADVEAQLAQNGRELLAVERDAVAAQGAALLAALAVDVERLAAQLTTLKELGDKHATIDLRVTRVSGWPGARIPNARNYEDFAGYVNQLIEAERSRLKREAEALNPQPAAPKRANTDRPDVQRVYIPTDAEMRVGPGAKPFKGYQETERGG